jgi:NAD(P)-dependent dehydrogenase (short-subunit alcohol dehydrogenase family)
MSVLWPSFTKTFHHKPYPAISPSRPELNANRKVVLVTGAGTGVGEATAYAFAEAGAKVIVLCGRRLHLLSHVKSKLESKYPTTKVAIYSLDITDQESATKVFQDVRVNCGPLDIVINSAGHLSDKGTIAESSLSNFWNSFEITVKGGFLIAQNFLHHCSSNDPVLISMNSLLAHFPAEHVGTAPGSYASSKMAQGKMIEYVAKENVGKIRAYNVHPGTIVTDMSTKSVEMADDPEATRKGLVWDDGRSSPKYA